jgi:hypothetical protein
MVFNSIGCQMKLPHTGIMCLKCNWVGFSWAVHDYKTCSCPNEAMVDGGYYYLRCGAMKLSDTMLVKLTEMKPKKRKKAK